MQPSHVHLPATRMHVLSDHPAPLNCSPPISPGPSVGGLTPPHNFYARPDYAICSSQETTFCDVATAPYGLGLQPAFDLPAQNTSRFPANGATLMREDSLGSPASPESLHNAYPQQYAHPPSPPAELPTDFIDELLSDASLTDHELDCMQLERVMEQEALTTLGLLPLSHPPPLVYKHRSTVADPFDWRMRNGDICPADLICSSSPANAYTLGPVEAKQTPVAKREPTVSLWEFLLEALHFSCYERILRWRNKENGTFKIVDSQGLARMWGCYKNRPDMNFDKMSRAMRYYYDKGILEKGESGARLEYKFGPRSNWLQFCPPAGAEAERFFRPRAPRRGRRQNQASKAATIQPFPYLQQAQPLSDPTQLYAAVPSHFGPQRSFQTNAGIRHTTFPY